jgi:hypothetical protein
LDSCGDLALRRSSLARWLTIAWAVNSILVLLGGGQNLPLTFVNPDPGKMGYEVIVGWEQ